MDILPVEWAKKVDWSQGGAEQRPAGRPPKAPVTALEAYAQYLKSRAVKSALNHAPDGEEQPSTEFLQVNFLQQLHLCTVCYQSVLRRVMHIKGMPASTIIQAT